MAGCVRRCAAPRLHNPHESHAIQHALIGRFLQTVTSIARMHDPDK